MDDDDLTALALDEARSRMRKTIASHQRDLNAVRTGRAQPSLIESLAIGYYGVPTPLKQLATITAPDARLLVIQPWDKNASTPSRGPFSSRTWASTRRADGVVIRLVIPELTEERRRQLVRQVGQKNEAARVALRNIRRDAQVELRKMLKTRTSRRTRSAARTTGSTS